MGARRRWKRTDLFLVRVWHDVGDRSEISKARTDSEDDEAGHNTGQTWHGQVRRVSNVEAHQFDSLNTLPHVLTAMLESSGDASRE